MNLLYNKFIDQMSCSSTGFPIKDVRFLKLKNIFYLLSDDKEGKIKENMD